MYKTTKQFVESYLSVFSEQEANTLVSVLFVIESLLKSTPSVSVLLPLLQEQDEDQLLIKRFLLLLAEHSKATTEEVKKIREHVESTMQNKESRFSVTVSPDAAHMETFLKNSFGKVEVDKKNNAKIGVSVTGEGYYFSRDLDHDLDNLLA